jgi:hypothetical protein
MDHLAQRTGIVKLGHLLIRVDSQELLIRQVRALARHIKVHILKALGMEQGRQRHTQQPRVLLIRRISPGLHIKLANLDLTLVVSRIPIVARQDLRCIHRIKRTLTNLAQVVQVDRPRVLIQLPKLVLSQRLKRVPIQQRNLVLIQRPKLAPTQALKQVPIQQDSLGADTKVGSLVVSRPAATKVGLQLDSLGVVTLVLNLVAPYHKLVPRIQLHSRQARIKQQSLSRAARIAGTRSQVYLIRLQQTKRMVLTVIIIPQAINQHYRQRL